MSLRILDVFSGVGGLSLGWINSSAPGAVHLVAAIDNDPSLEECFKFNFPYTEFLLHEFADPLQSSDAQAVTERLNLKPGDIDVVLAGPPCQTFSAAGKRQLRWDARLVFQVVEIVVNLKPKIVLIENVPEFNKAEEGRLLGRVRVALSASGYSTDFRVLNAANFGVPQSRNRSFLLGIHSSLNVPAQIIHTSLQYTNLFLPGETASVRNLPLLDFPLPQAITVGEALDDLPSISAGEGKQESFISSQALSDYQRQLRSDEGMLYNHMASNHSKELLSAMKLLLPGETPQSIPDHPLRRKEYFRAAYARLDPNVPAPTITTQTHNAGSGRFTHYSDDRVITVREAARLQSFPDSFRFFGTQHNQRRQVGNAVPPILSEHLASMILGYL